MMISRDRCSQEAGSTLTLNAGFQEPLEFGLFEGHVCLLLNYWKLSADMSWPRLLVGIESKLWEYRSIICAQHAQRR